jgi:iron complex outermembrane receptor protein
MNVAPALRKAQAFTPLALVASLALCFAAPALAQDGAIPSVLITGSRFPSAPELAPIGATVISADQIRRAGVSDVDQAIRKIGGVFGRQSLDSSPDFSLDLRGFGSNSSQNMVIMLDGVRLNENELASPVLSSIPIETVERIEIIRGGSSVLYGEGGTAGVIQIVTRRPAKNSGRGTLRAEAGQFNQHDLRASYAKGWDGFAFDAAVNNQGTDNYRDNARFRQDAISAGAQWLLGAGRVGVRIDSARRESRFPGPLKLDEFQANPRQTKTPHDFGSLDTDRISAFIEQRVGAFDLAAELSHRERTAKAHYVFPDTGYGETISDMAYDSEQTQFSPRLRHLAQLGGTLNELVVGVDLTRWKRVTNASFSRADARQDSKAIYVRDEIRWDPAHNGRFSVGARHEVFDKDYVDPLGYPAPIDEHTSQSQNAWEVQGSYSVLPKVALHAKAGQSYRVANADENSAGALKGQTSHDLELGVTLGDASRELTARAFRHNLTNEIFFDPTLNFGTNTNLAPTRRQGVEIDASASLSASWRASAHLQHVEATFTEGPNAGREMVLVPKNLLSARLSWTPAGGHTADVGVQWVDSQRYASDFANSCAARIPSHATFDARYARTIGQWEFAVAGLNLADKQHFTYAYGCQYDIYPGDGRQIRLSARYDF